MTIREAIKKYPEDETELFLSHLLKLDRTQLYTQYQKKLTDLQAKNLSELIKKLRLGWPVAYLLGYKFFYGLKFKVNKHTLIPRPETEWLIDKALDIFKVYKHRLLSESKISILDIGTGSGCIAITLSKLLPNSSVTATDISSGALKVAKQNSQTHKVKIKFSKTSLLPKTKTKFDIIIANLPYVPSKFYKQNYENLKHEPKSALVDKNNNGDLYIELLNKLTARQPRFLLLEIDPELTSLLKHQIKLLFPKAKITFHRDLHKLNRYSVIDFQS